VGTFPLEPGILRIARDVVAGVAPRGRQADGVDEIAAPVTVRFICEQLALGNIESAKIQDWFYAVVAQSGRMQAHESMVESATKICESQLFLKCRRDRKAPCLAATSRAARSCSCR
jgi:hypothetical protein